MKVVVLLDGPMTVTHEVNTLLDADRVIAADGGIRHAEPLGLMPDLWVGDFDSTAKEPDTKFCDVLRKTYPSKKDMSDGELAIEEALALNPDRIVLCGALGGERTDHSLFVILLALKKALENPAIDFVLTNGLELGFPVLPGLPLTLKHRKDATLSIVPFSVLQGLSISGVEWPLDTVSVQMGSSHTLSNYAVGDIVINLQDGHAMAIVQSDHEFEGIS